MSGVDPKRFEHLNYEAFRKLAQDSTLSSYERIGFPDSYREGHEAAIFEDIQRKLPRLHTPRQLVLDIGPGCSQLPGMIIDLCQQQGHRLLLADSPEMLDQLPDHPFIAKFPGFYPKESASLFEAYTGHIDVIVIYSVLHYIYVDMNLMDFLDRTLSLLAPGGQLLIGDIPNVSKRKRFFSAESGIAYHKAYTGQDAPPIVQHLVLEPGKIDDAVLLGMIMRCHAAGFDAYWLPQDQRLPMANRRDDLLIVRP